MQGSLELAEVLSDIRSLKAECELLLKVVETIDEDDGPGGSCFRAAGSDEDRERMIFFA